MNAPLGQLELATAPGPDKRSASPFIKRGLIGAFILFIVMGGWAALFKIKGAVIAPGQIVVESKPKTLQHLDGGIVGEILVKDGDRVDANQVVMRLDPTAKNANKAIIEKRLYEALARSARLQAERDNKEEIEWPAEIMADEKRPELALIMMGQKKLFDARKKSSQGMVSQLHQRINQSRQQIRGLNDLIRSKQAQKALIEQELVGQRKLLIKGLTHKSRILGLERELARLSGDISTHRSDISRTESSINETRMQILQINKEKMAEVLTELRATESEISDLKEQLVTASDQLKRVDVTSPVAGIVHNMEVTTIGGVVTAGQPIMQIIPVNDRLIVEASIMPQDVDQVYKGQDARINLSAFSQRIVPQLNGKVIERSADAIIDKVTGMPYFTVKVEIPPEEMEKLGEMVLVPGMPAEVFLQTKERSVLSYLLKPFKDQLGRAFREE